MKVGDRVVVISRESYYCGHEGDVVRAPGDADRPPSLPGFVEIRLQDHLAESLFRIEEVEVILGRSDAD